MMCYPEWSETKICFVPLPANFVLEFIIRKVQENLEELELNGTHHMLVYADC